MSYYVYVILCQDGSFYTGYTKDVEARMRLHVNGKGARYTRMHRPKKLVYTEAFRSRAEAMKRERKVKTMGHQQKLRLIRSRSKFKRHT
jgi:putative endonuclease